MINSPNPMPRPTTSQTTRNDSGAKQNLDGSAAGAALVSKRTQDRRFDQGLYAFHRGDYTNALKDFSKSSEVATRNEDSSRYVESCTYILRILAEREEFSRIDQIEKRILDILRGGALSPGLKSRALYVLGICNCYNDLRHEQAMRRFRESIDMAILSEDKSTLASPLYGIATVHYALENYEEALKELDRLTVLISCLKLPDIESAAHLLRALVYRNQSLYDEALESAWRAFESLKHNPHLGLYLQTLTALGTIYRLKGDDASARLYLDLADRSLRRDEFPRIARLIDDAFESLGAVRNEEADLVFDTRTGILVARAKGEIRFEGQFILRDLLRVFLEHPGRVFTKEDLVRLVWRESYDPKIHDNKIYVTIKRLRKLLEPETDKSDYILRAKNGYFLNPKTRVQINSPAILSATSDAGAKNPSTEKTK